MTNERAIQILENLISINGDVIIGDEDREALEMAIRSLQQERQEQPDKSLEEAAENIYKVPFGTRAEDFIAGAEWQREDMMKDAVEGEVMTNGFYPYEPRIVAPYPDCPYDFGDKVKIVIVKEDKE